MWVSGLGHFSILEFMNLECLDLGFVAFELVGVGMSGFRELRGITRRERGGERAREPDGLGVCTQHWDIKSSNPSKHS